ncbi:dihydroneopterin aldolase [Lewinella sp. JB7]|uniref:dihydroneopterin aldolase n=1 Tax=Lewinella sp. JB7 TaxID=2962887 RepID=UPI0020C93B8F|nr:dihydroneopterin aldolase [Lewinella sp. JB7]MCP9237037.1 dihydroneopterin aldolase [Lewinella sp. JB7]
MMAKIGLEDVRFQAPHGFFEEEHLMGNEFSIDIEVEASVAGAAEEDDLGGTVNYSTIYYLLQAEMKKPAQLLEALAYRMASRIMNQFDGVASVRLKLRKLSPPLGGRVGAAFVEIELGGAGGAMPAPTGRAQHTFEDPDEDYPDDFKPPGSFDISGFNF